MLIQLVLNIGIAFVWALLQAEFTIQSFMVGYFLGLVILYIFKNQFSGKLYIYKWWAVFLLFMVFIKELIIANFIVIVQILRPKLNIRPGIIAFPVDLETPVQITLLANMISLTPGTLSMEISQDNKIIYIHVFNIDEQELVIKRIKESFESKIKEVVS